MDGQIILEVKGGALTVTAPPMSLAELNLHLDLAKKNMLEKGQPDVIIQPDPPAPAPVKASAAK